MGLGLLASIPAFAGVATPEIDPASVSSALALLGGAMLLIRQKKKS